MCVLYIRLRALQPFFSFITLQLSWKLEAGMQFGMFGMSLLYDEKASNSVRINFITGNNRRKSQVVSSGYFLTCKWDRDLGRAHTIFNPYFQLPKYCLDDKLFSYFMKNVSSAPHWFDDERNQNNRKRRRWNVKKLSINKPDFLPPKLVGFLFFWSKITFVVRSSVRGITFGVEYGSSFPRPDRH